MFFIVGGIIAAISADVGANYIEDKYNNLSNTEKMVLNFFGKKIPLEINHANYYLYTDNTSNETNTTSDLTLYQEVGNWFVTTYQDAIDWFRGYSLTEAALGQKAVFPDNRDIAPTLLSNMIIGFMILPVWLTIPLMLVFIISIAFSVIPFTGG